MTYCIWPNVQHTTKHCCFLQCNVLNLTLHCSVMNEFCIISAAICKSFLTLYSNLKHVKQVFIYCDMTGSLNYTCKSCLVLHNTVSHCFLPFVGHLNIKMKKKSLNDLLWLYWKQKRKKMKKVTFHSVMARKFHK